MVLNCDKSLKSPGYHPVGVEDIFLAAVLASLEVVKRRSS